MNNSTLLAIAGTLVETLIDYYGDGEGDYIKPFQSKDLADCVIQHAAAAGVSSMAAGILPGAGSVIATGISAGAIWAMYIRICKMIGMKIGKNKLKFLASAALTNLASNLAALLVAGGIASFVPGAGVVVCGAGTFAVVYIAGIIFLKTLIKMFHVKRSDVENADEDEWIASIKDSVKNMDKKALFREAKGVFMDMRQSGDLDRKGSSVDITPEDD